MKKESIIDIKKSIELSFLIKNYLLEYLEDKIQELIDEYEIDENLIDEISIIGYNYLVGNKIIVISIQFPDEVYESGYGIEQYDIKLDDFINWLETYEHEVSDTN